MLLSPSFTQILENVWAVYNTHFLTETDVLSPNYTCVFFIHRFLSVEVVTGTLFPVPHPGRWKPMYLYTFLQPSLPVFHLYWLDVYSLLLRFSVSSQCRMDCASGNIKTSARLFSDVAQFLINCLIYRLISRVTALQRAFGLVQVSSRSLLVSFIVLFHISTFEFQSESSASMFNISCFCLQA